MNNSHTKDSNIDIFDKSMLANHQDDDVVSIHRNSILSYNMKLCENGKL